MNKKFSKLDRKRIYGKALIKWGIDAQLRMLMEECAELIQSTNKFMRDSFAVESLAQEIADVEIMIEQIKTFCGSIMLQKKVDIWKETKLERLSEELGL